MPIAPGARSPSVRPPRAGARQRLPARSAPASDQHGERAGHADDHRIAAVRQKRDQLRPTARVRGPAKPARGQPRSNPQATDCGAEDDSWRTGWRRERPGEPRRRARRARSRHSQRAAAGVPRPARTTQRPARHSSAPGRATRPSGRSPIRPAPRKAKPTCCPTSQSAAEVRSTAGSPAPACGAAIQPMSTSSVTAASPAPVTTAAAIAPLAISGRWVAAGSSAPDPPGDPVPAGPVSASPGGTYGRGSHKTQAWQSRALRPTRRAVH